MVDIEITQKEIENKLFDFIEENFGKKKYECFNEVVNFVEDKIIPTLINTDDDINGCIEDLEIENNELEDRVMELENTFDTLKGDCCDRLEEIESDLEDIIENNESNSVLNKLKELKEDVKNHRWIVENADDF
jgi:predicted RNase H-like nuclease (RuvC/YqgF family)